MFVGNQRNDFIQKLRRTAGTDVYLQGALYLLETDAFRRRTRLDELAAREYARTEEALFVLSLFNDPETGYQAMRPQLTRLFGPCLLYTSSAIRTPKRTRSRKKSLSPAPTMASLP